MKRIFLIAVMLLMTSTLQAHTVYKWVDGKGIVNYTDDYDNIPPAYRDQVEIEWVHEESSSVPGQKVIPQKSEETQTDIYGRDEAYWKGKVRPWKEFLKNAEANYEAAHKRFMDKAMEFSRKRFGTWSKTQYKMNVIELDRLKDEMIKYGDQVAEAKEGLEKILKEAREAKADPDWLK